MIEARRFSHQGGADLPRQMLGRRRSTLRPDHALQLPLELHTIEAWAAGGQVPLQAERAVPIELPVKVMLDLLKDVVAVSL
jgi:hypothetical protein